MLMQQRKKMAELDAKGSSEASVKYEVEDEETLATDEIDVYYDAVPDGVDEETVNGMSFKDAEKYVNEKGLEEPDPADYGVWVPGIPALLDKALLDDEGNPVCAEPLYGLIMDGIVAGVGAVLGFVPQMLVLFIFLAFLGSMWIHGTYRIYHGPNFPSISVCPVNPLSQC